MIVARTAAWAAVGLAVLGLMLALSYGDPFLGAAAVSVLFVAALFWSLADIGDRLGEPAPQAVARPATAPLHAAEAAEFEGPVSTLEDFDKKLAAAKAK
jgi:hypothetical protein